MQAFIGASDAERHFYWIVNKDSTLANWSVNKMADNLQKTLSNRFLQRKASYVYVHSTKMFSCCPDAC